MPIPVILYLDQEEADELYCPCGLCEFFDDISGACEFNQNSELRPVFVYINKYSIINNVSIITELELQYDEKKNYFNKVGIYKKEIDGELCWVKKNYHRPEADFITFLPCCGATLGEEAIMINNIAYIFDCDYALSSEEQISVMKKALEDRGITCNLTGYMYRVPAPDKINYSIFIIDYGGGMFTGQDRNIYYMLRDFLNTAQENPNKIFVIESDVKKYVIEEPDVQELLTLPNVVFGIDNLKSML